MKSYIYRLGICFVLALCIGLRLYHVTAPIADWHSFRQVDTAGVAVGFLRFGFDIFHPRYEDLSNIQSGKDNPMGYRMVEFPMYQYIAATLAKSFSQLPIDVWLRLVNIAACAGTALILILLVARFANPTTGLLTGLVYALLPYSMFYGRAILPDTFAVFWAMLGVWLVAKYTDKRSWVFLALASLASAVALLAKPTAAFLLVPVGYLFLRIPKKNIVWIAQLVLYGAIAVLPLFFWRKWILQFPEGIPVSEWLFNSNHIRFKGAWFHWIFAERVGNLILGYWGLVLLGLGMLVKSEKKEGSIFRWFLLGSLAYVTIFATGNVQHDYYQIIIIPTIAIYVAKGLYFLLTNTIFSRVASWTVAVACMLAMLGFSWFTMRTFYWINRPEIIEAGKMADQILPKDAKVIAPYNGDTTFLYYTNRQGWPLGFDIEDKIKKGATTYVTVSPTDNDWETKTLAEQYTVLVRNDKYAIIDLTKPASTRDDSSMRGGPKKP